MKLIAPILIVNIVMLLLGGLILYAGVMNVNSMNNAVIGDINQLFGPNGNNIKPISYNDMYSKINSVLIPLFIYALPLFVILTSGLYLYKNPRNYLKSLIIPASYIILSFLLFLLIMDSRIPFDLTDKIPVSSLLIQYAVLFVAVVIINLVIRFIRKIK